MREGWMECELNEIILHTIGGTWGSDPGTREIEVISFGTKAFAGGQEFLDPGSGASRSISSAQYAKRELLAGDIILEVSGGSEDQPVGRTLYVKDDMPHVVPSSFFRLLRFDSRVIDPDYARLLMQWLYLNGTTRLHQSNTTSIRNLKVPEFLAVRVSVPPSAAQRRIVDLMSHVDSLRAALSEEAARLFSALCAFRDSIWDVPQRVPLSRYCRVDGGLVDPTGEGQRDRPHVGTDRIASGTGDLIGVQSVSEDGVTSGKFEFSERHVVYSKIRPNLMKVAMPTFSGLCSADAYPLLPAPGVPRRWLQQLLLTTEFTTLAVSQSGRTKMPKINQPSLMGLMVPDIAHGAREEQAVVLDALDALRVGLGKERDALDRQRAALLGSLLTGDHAIPSSYDEFTAMKGRRDGVR